MRNRIGIEALHEDFGARVTGVELSGDISREDLGEIRAAIDSYSVLCFPGQDMSDDTDHCAAKNFTLLPRLMSKRRAIAPRRLGSGMWDTWPRSAPQPSKGSTHTLATTRRV